MLVENLRIAGLGEDRTQLPRRQISRPPNERMAVMVDRQLLGPGFQQRAFCVSTS
jgi:hypothetical protein